MERFLAQLKRTWVEICVLAAIGIALFLMPPIIKQGLELFLYKILLFSASQLHAFILRLWMFPYIDFSSTDNKYHQLMAIVIHVSAAYVYGVGG